jgi:DNA segregation ATPase FtsK/SpoIIIE, S-DNA-T family
MYADDYEYYDDEDYYEEEEDYLDYTEDEGGSAAAERRSRFSSGSSPFSARSGGLPGGSSRFSGGSRPSKDDLRSRFAGGGDDDDDAETSSASRGSRSSRFSGRSDDSSSRGSSGSSRFGVSPFSSGGDDKSDDKSDDSKSGSRFSGSRSSRFSGGGSSSSRFGKKDDDKKDDKSDDSKSGSRFSGSRSSRFSGGGSSSSRFDKKDDKSDDSKSGSRVSGSRSSRFSGGSSSRFGKKDDDNDKKSNRKKDDKGDSKDQKSDDSGGGLFGRFSGGGNKDDKSGKSQKSKDDSSGGGGLFGGIASALGGDDDKDDKSGKSQKSNDDSGGSGLFGRFSGGGNKDDKTDDKSSKSQKSNDDSGGGGFLGRFRGGNSDDDTRKDSKDNKSGKPSKSGKSGKSDDKASKGGKKQSPFGARGRSRNTDDKSDDKSSKSSKSSKSGKDSKSDDKQADDAGIGGRVAAAFGGLFGGGGADDSKSSSKSSRSRGRSKKPKTPTVATEDGLTLDNWLDIIGVGLVFLSLVFFFSMISRDQAAISAIHKFFGQLFGWGAVAVPVTMFVIGMWLIIRHFGDDAPTVDPIRVVGIALGFVTLLVVFQYIDTFNYTNLIAIAEDNGGVITSDVLWHRLNWAWEVDQSGGGIIGAYIYFYLNTTVTDLGGFFVLLFTSLLSAMLITRLSAAEIVTAIAGVGLTLREYTKQRAVQKRAERQLAAQKAAELQAQQQAQLATEGAPADAMPAAAQAADQQALQAPATTEAEREIRFNLGGQSQTLRTGQQAANGRQYAAQPTAPPPPAMPQQPAASNANTANSSGGGLFSRLGLGSSGKNNGNTAPANGNGGFGLFGSGGNLAAPPPPPLDAPLPMDDIPNAPNVPTTQMPYTSPTPAASSSTPSQQPQTPRVGDLMRGQGPTTGDHADTPAQQPAAKVFDTAGAFQPDDRQATQDAPAPSDVDPVKARQDRLDALRRGEVGPLSQSNMAQARHEAAINRPPEDPLQSPLRRSTPAPKQAAPEVDAVDDGQSVVPASSGMRPSQLPSAQPDGKTEPHQQRLAAMPQQPTSSEVQRSSRPRIQWETPEYRSLLSTGGEQEFDRELLLKQAKLIEDTLQAFGAPGRVVEVNTGPVITQFGVEPDYLEGRSGRKQRVKVSAIAALDKDLQLALGARSIRVEAPVPGKGYVGIEVPNKESTLVSLRDVMDSPGFAKHKSPLAIALGQSVSGAPISADLATMPHLLIAGTTGSGKSVCVNSIITSIITRNTPDQVKFIMVDPKRVELTGYNGIPHLVAPVVVELERIVGVLKWVTREMDERYKKFSEAQARNIEDYNKHIDPTYEAPMPYIVVIIDELADLMMLAPEETERTITRIAALARATGIHLVIATQRPSVDVVTGLIKANFPARIAFAVAGSVDSRVILDQPGADRLLGKGDMLYLSGDSPAPLRLQGVFVSDMEITNIVRYWKMQAVNQPEQATNSTILAPRFAASDSAPQSAPTRNAGARQQAFWDNDEPLPSFATGASGGDSAEDDEDAELTQRELTGDVKDGNEDELYDKAVELVRRLDKASISLLQRRLRIGYTRAARLIDVMEARGVVGPAKEGSSKPRDVIPT